MTVFVHKKFLIWSKLWTVKFLCKKLFLIFYEPIFYFSAAVFRLAPRCYESRSDFIMAVRNSLVSRRSGIFTSIGLGFGIMVHVSYCLLGVGFIVSQSILLFNFLKIFAAPYLIYIGWKSWNSGVSESKDIEKQKVKLSNLESLRIGFLTNVFNPKVTLFFLGLFTIGVQPGTPLFPQIIFGLVVSFGTMAWFSL